MADYIIIAVLIIIIGLASFYLYKAKKKGKKCIGCPHCGICASKSGRGSS